MSKNLKKKIASKLGKAIREGFLDDDAQASTENEFGNEFGHAVGTSEPDIVDLSVDPSEDPEVGAEPDDRLGDDADVLSTDEPEDSAPEEDSATGDDLKATLVTLANAISEMKAALDELKNKESAAAEDTAATDIEPAAEEAPAPAEGEDTGATESEPAPEVGEDSGESAPTQGEGGDEVASAEGSDEAPAPAEEEKTPQTANEAVEKYSNNGHILDPEGSSIIGKAYASKMWKLDEQFMEIIKSKVAKKIEESKKEFIASLNK